MELDYGIVSNNSLGFIVRIHNNKKTSDLIFDAEYCPYCGKKFEFKKVELE